MQIFELDESEISKVAHEINKLLKSVNIVLLRGNLASGKTTLVKEIATFFGIKKDEVSSPTFSTLNRYTEFFYHYDIYIAGVDGIMQNGLFENFNEKGVHLVEWGDEKLENILKQFGFSYLVVEIEDKENKRVYKVSKCIN